MCLILLAHEVHPAYPLVVAANRDEWFHRPTLAARFWPTAPRIVAGRDLMQGGTWLGVTTAGRFAALTNFRDPAAHRADAPSRGALVSDFLAGQASPADYLRHIAVDAARFNGFNLLAGVPGSLGYVSNRDGAQVRALPPGVYGLSNHLLDTDWRKVRRGKTRLREVLAAPAPSFDELFDVLGDTSIASDDDLPATGVPLERERLLSPAHLRGGEYGTRCATVLVIGRDGRARFSERSFDRDGTILGVVREEFALDN